MDESQTTNPETTEQEMTMPETATTQPVVKEAVAVIEPVSPEPVASTPVVTDDKQKEGKAVKMIVGGFLVIIVIIALAVMYGLFKAA